MEIVDVHLLLESIVQMYQTEIAAKRIEVALHLAATDHHVRADPGRLQQAFWNVLKNAVKFTSEGGRIEIATRDSEKRIRISISDSGVGISEEMVPRLFQPFEQESAARYGGLGLGLAITKTLLEAQSGSIEAFSPGIGQGATFTMTLPNATPASRSDPVIKPDSQSSEADARFYRILLVEDHQDTARVLARLLRGVGHDVSTAHSVADAISAVRGKQFDVVVSDIGLPDGTGIDLIRELRQRHGQTLAAIALTGFGMEEDVARTKQAGFDEHLSKPVNLMHLEETIQRACRNKGGELVANS